MTYPHAQHAQDILDEATRVSGVLQELYISRAQAYATLAVAEEQATTNDLLRQLLDRPTR